MQQLYRFQGGNTYPSFDVKNNKYDIDVTRGYTYFSASIHHHKYFTYKRLKQYLDEKLREAKNIPYSTKLLAQEDYYRRIRKFVASCDMDLFSSIGIKPTSSFISLINENALPRPKLIPKAIERVDRRAFGGGYGLCDEWLELLNCLTLTYHPHRITRSDILEVLRSVRMNRGPLIDSLNFLATCDREFIVNSAILDDFIKYRIMELLTEIIVKQNCSPSSQLIQNPRAEIQTIVNDFLTERDKLFSELDKMEKQGISFKFTHR